MATAANTPLTAYAGPVLSADWWRRYLASNRSWYLVATTVILGYLFLFLLGAVANVIGFRGINWFTGFVIQLITLVVVASWLHFVAVGGLGFIAGQPGGEAGLSTADGATKAKEWLHKLGRFILHVGLNAPVAFYALAIWPIRAYPYLAFIVLAAGVSIALAATLLWPDSKTMFWTKLLWFVHLIIVLGAIAFFSSMAVAPEQSRRVTSWIESRWSVNPADNARDAATAKIRQARIDAAAKCYRELAAEPSQADKDRCEALYKAIDESLIPKVAPTIITERATAAEQMNAGVDHPSVPATPAPKPTVAKANVDLPWVCDRLVREVDYSPGHQYGPVAIGELPAGRYAISVAGKRQQPFYTGMPAVLDKLCEMDADGNIGVCTNAVGKTVSDLGGRSWPAPAQALVPSSEGRDVPYGMFVLRAGGKVHLIGSEGRIETPHQVNLELDVNNFQSPLNYGGRGSLRVQIRQCT